MTSPFGMPTFVKVGKKKTPKQLGAPGTVRPPTEGSPATLPGNSICHIDSSTATSRDITLPSGLSGDRLFAFVASDDENGTVTTPTGWTLLSPSPLDATQGIVNLYYLDIDGSETVMTVATSSNTTVGAIIWVLSNGAQLPAPEAAMTSAVDGQANPPSITPSAGAGSYWVFAGAYATNASFSTVSEPSGYDSIESCGTSSPQMYITVGSKLVDIVTQEDPAAFGDSVGATRVWGAFTIAVAQTGDPDVAAFDHDHTESDITDLDHWTESDHDALDHTGLTGVGGGGGFASSTEIVTGGTNTASFPGAVWDAAGDNLHVFYRSGTDHNSNDGDILHVKATTPEGLESATPATILNNSSFDYRDPSLTRLADGTLVAVGGRRTSGGATVTDGSWLVTSSDDGDSWSSESNPDDNFTSYSRAAGNLLELANGDWLLAVYGKDSGDTFTTTRIIKSTDSGSNWSTIGTIADGETDSKNYNECGLALLANGDIRAILRNETDGDLMTVLSDDSGVTWGTPAQLIDGGSGMPRPVVTRDDAILFMYRVGTAGDDMIAAYSLDDGATATDLHVFDEGGTEGAYGQPAIHPVYNTVTWVYAIDFNSGADANLYVWSEPDALPHTHDGSGTDHGGLSGLTDDDHTQYSKADGTRAFTGTVSGVTPTLDAHLATKAYVDSNSSAYYEVIVSGSAPPVAVTTEDETDWVYGEVT